MSKGDPEITRAVELMQRVDLDDLVETRHLMGSDGLSFGAVQDRYGALVTVEDHRVNSARGPIDVRVYRPVGEALPSNAVLMLHGGAFVGGDLATEHARCLRFAAEARCVVVSPEYRLAPEQAYPHGLNDCYVVLEWMTENSARLGAADEKVVVAGVSAGGALAAGLALMSRDRGGPPIRAQMLLYPVLDDRLSTGSKDRFTGTPVWDSVNNAKMWALYLGDSMADHYAAPARAENLHDLPPTYLLIAEVDPLRDEALEYGTRLLAAGVSVDIRLWAGGFHAFDQLLPEADLSNLSLTDQVNFIRRLGQPQRPSVAGV